MSRRLTTFIICAVVGLALVYYLPPFLGPAIFGENLTGVGGFMVLVSKLWWWILVGTLIVASILSIIFKTQGKSIKKIWMVSGIIIGVALLIMMFSLLMGASALYQGIGTQ